MADALSQVAVYRRRVHGPLALVWENVLDWEHLPWLHRRSFRSIEPIDAGRWGWRARVGLAPAGEIALEVLVERETGSYVARTLAGPGAGSEVRTRLASAGSELTDVAVSFHVPGAAPGRSAGPALVALYTRLWDEDESMIARRAALLAHPRAAAELNLGRLAELRARLPLEVELAGWPVRVVELEGRLLAYVAACPHRLGPLEADGGGELRCPWHGYRFELRSGKSCDGRALRLLPAPRVELDGPTGEVRLVAAAAATRA